MPKLSKPLAYLLALVFTIPPCLGQERSTNSILLQGNAEKRHRASHHDLEPDQPEMDNPSIYNGRSNINTATVEDQAMLVEWDKWRNRVSRKVWLKLNEELSGGACFALGGLIISSGQGSPYHFRKGIAVTYACDVTNDRRITNLRVTSPSGDPTYDRLVLYCVQSLAGKHTLKFPEGSRRTKVKIAATFKIGHAAFHETKYGDTEVVKLSQDNE